MAVSISAAGHQYARAISLGNVASWTVTCWIKLASTRGGVSQVPWQIDDGNGGNFFRFNFYNGADATHQTSGNAWFGLFGLTATMGTWYFVGISGTATPGQEQVRIAHRPDGSLTWGGGVTPQAATTFSAQVLRLGGSHTATAFIDGSMCSVKVWDTALTREEMMNESFTVRPRRTTGLRAWYPWHEPDRTDYSGNGWTLLISGAGLDRQGPALSWGQGRRRILRSSSGALPVEGGITAALPALEGSLSGGLTTAASLAAVLPSLSGDLTGAATVSGHTSAELPALGAAAEGHVGAPGLLTALLPPLSAQLTGEVTGGFLVASLPALTGGLDGTLNVHGQPAATLPTLAGALVGEVEIPPHDITVIPGPPERRWGSRGPATSWTASTPARGWRARPPAT